MAMYHFRIKSDKRTNGSITNAVSHIKYINREGEYADVDSKQELANQHFSQNIISGQNSSIMPDFDSMEMLYRSPFGSIIGVHDTICISDNPSPTTIDIAVTYAYKQSDGILNINGTTEFKAQVILCAADLNLDVKFYDQEMQKQFEELKKEYNTNENTGDSYHNQNEITDIINIKGSDKFDGILKETAYEENNIFENENLLSDESDESFDDLFSGEDFGDESFDEYLESEEGEDFVNGTFNGLAEHDGENDRFPSESEPGTFDELFAGEDFGDDDFPEDTGDEYDYFGGDGNSSSETETDNIHESDSKLNTEEAASTIISSMHIMQRRNMDGEKPGSEMLLSNDEENKLRNNEEGLVHTEIMRRENVSRNDDEKPRRITEKRNISIARINRAEKTTMQMIFASTGMIKGADHVAYINREEQFASRGGCVYTDSHLPSWAKDAKDFFEEADKNERINGTRYKEIEFALPNELNLEQQKEIINEFISHHLSDFYYAYAVHEKIGALSNEQNHPHVHIMFSERRLDDYEKEHERERGIFFKKVSYKNPSQGGCPKDKKFNGKDRTNYLRYMRRDFANIQNKILAKYGYSVTVDHRSLKAQKEDAIQRGDVRLAKLLDRLPEKSIGPIAAHDRNNKRTLELLNYRKLKNEDAIKDYCERIFIDSNISITAFNAILEMDQTIKFLNKSKDILENSSYNYENMMSLIKTRRNNMAKMYSSNQFYDEVLKKAISKQMSTDNAEKYNQMTELMENRNNLKNFINSYGKPSKTSGDYTTYNEINASFQKQIEEYNNQIKKLAKELQPAFRNLNNPTTKKLIMDDVVNTLEKNSKYKKSLAKLADETNVYCDKIHQIISDEKNKIIALEKSNQNKTDTSYTATQLLAYTYESKKIIMNRMKAVVDRLKATSQSHISETAARNIAISIFTNGESKKLNKEKKELAKTSERLKAAYEELRKNKKLETRQNPALQEKYRKMKETYESRLSTYQAQLTKYESARQALEIYCHTPKAEERINEITLKILSKNIINNKHYESLESELKNLKTKNQELNGQIQVLKEKIRIDKKNKTMPRYSVSASAPIPAGKRKKYTPAILAGVLGGDERMANLRAYVKVDAVTAQFLASQDDDLEID